MEWSQDIWRAISNNAPHIILVVDREGLVQYVNHVVPGLSKEEVIGTKQLDYVEPEHQDLVKKTNEKVFQTAQSASYEIRGTGPHGQIAWYSTSVGPIKSNGKVVAISIHTTNITKQREAEKALEGAKDELIEKQSRAIRELSTPVIQVWDQILVLPLIGPIDTPRAQQIVENLLDAIVNTQSTAVIIDITGVPIIDTQVAGHFLETMNASKMLGAEVILTGVSPVNAQTLVKLGVDLGEVVTKGSLHAGLKSAFVSTKRKVVEAE